MYVVHFTANFKGTWAGVNILPLFRYFGCGTVLDFWHFSEKIFGRNDIVSLKNGNLFRNLKRD